ncbi:uncharacterized protein A1O9_09532 [Exophiala aquamarina CBS 119918]|uniref:Amino acid transporter transmembrane domain-containing protein n=1 Tax=Exophiala aquamarina CBS 119918 TaxID=1182545 RepID=A0A072P3F6_9EURO|nr:uncharacterized protein A1O9_09532 [Exophiala aquamarina CBS 119918]KEF54366.1 hypothetical protein A1O9_09532 [Exophiala aquamarina CBS 119918]
MNSFEAVSRSKSNSEIGEKMASVVGKQLNSEEDVRVGDMDDDGEVFKANTEKAKFRALGTLRTTVVLVKLCFATGVLSIPAALGVVGYGPGLVLLALWSGLTMYYSYVMYQFRMKYRGVHNIVDAAMLVGGPIAREVTSVLFLLTWILATGSGFIGLSQGLKILANGKGCTILWTLVAAVATGLLSSIRTLGKLAILTWIGFASIFTAVFIIVVGVTVVDRPAAAPPTGPYDLGVIAVGSPGFVAGLVAALNLFSGFGSTSTFMPVIAEMKVPKKFPKALLISQGFLVVCYMTFGIVIYIYCGQYIASPSLASAGGTLEKVAYGVSIPGFMMTSTLWVHVAAKFLLVRILRDSNHLQSNSVTHWATWLSSTIGLTILSFLLAEAIPFFNYILGFIGSICCSPTCLVIPAIMGLYMHRDSYRSNKRIMALCAFHCIVVVGGSFMAIAGTYTTIQSIVDAYAVNGVKRAFTCS